MKLKEVDYEISEELFATNCMLKMLINEYDGKIPNDVIDSIEHSLVLAEKHLAKDFIPEVDIDKMKLVSRVTFDMDSIKRIRKNKKRLKLLIILLVTKCLEVLRKKGFYDIIAMKLYLFNRWCFYGIILQ